jgi:hypothetical protein
MAILRVMAASYLIQLPDSHQFGLTNGQASSATARTAGRRNSLGGHDIPASMFSSSRITYSA